MTLLRVDDVKVWFGGVKAVDGISLTLEPGRIYGIVGPNGSGKTTLLNAISGVQRLTAGRVEFDGEDRTSSSDFEVARTGIARTFQLIKLLPTLTVRENVLLGGDWTGARAADARHRLGARRRAAIARRDEARRAADEALERLGIAGLAEAAPDELPYGTRRRVEIARALTGDPKLLLLDEPIAGMSRSERDEIATIMRRLGDDGLTQLVIEHDLRTLLTVCDHLFVMNFGRLIADGPPRETAALPAVQEAYLGRSDAVA
jgi:ABC-type branched-subunit amino acid transport system ATPase component